MKEIFELARIQLAELEASLEGLDQLLLQRDNKVKDSYTAENENQIINTFKELTIKFPSNPQIFSRFLTFSQMIDSDVNVETYALDDISGLFVTCRDLFYTDIEFHTEYFHYKFVMEDKEEEAAAELLEFKNWVSEELDIEHFYEG